MLITLWTGSLGRKKHMKKRNAKTSLFCICGYSPNNGYMANLKNMLLMPCLFIFTKRIQTWITLTRLILSLDPNHMSPRTFIYIQDYKPTNNNDSCTKVWAYCYTKIGRWSTSIGSSLWSRKQMNNKPPTIAIPVPSDKSSWVKQTHSSAHFLFFQTARHNCRYNFVFYWKIAPKTKITIIVTWSMECIYKKAAIKKPERKQCTSNSYIQGTFSDQQAIPNVTKRW